MDLNNPDGGMAPDERDTHHCTEEGLTKLTGAEQMQYGHASLHFYTSLKLDMTNEDWKKLRSCLSTLERLATKENA